MRGRVAVNWLWGWLGQIGQGSEYEVLETIQPVVNVDGIEWPPLLVPYASSTALVAGDVVVNLPGPPAGKSRVWVQLWFNRTNVAATDITQLRRGVTGAQSLIWTSTGTLTVNVFYPIIGGVYLVAPGTLISGVQKQIASQIQPSLSINATAAAAVGNINVAGAYVDVPQQAPILMPVF